MLQNLSTAILQRPEQGYLDWLYPQNRPVFVNGLIFTFITVSALSLVDYFYYARIEHFPVDSAVAIYELKPFALDNFFRLIIVPLINLGAIFLARSGWNRSIGCMEKIAAAVIFVSTLSFLSTGLSNEYYSGEDFAYDALVLMLFSQLLFGLPFRTSFLHNLFLMLVILVYMSLDHIPERDFIWTLSFFFLVGIPVLVGTFKLEQSKILNFNTITKLEYAHQELVQQKELLRTGENVSKLVSWRASKDLKTISFSDGIEAIFEFEKNKVESNNLLNKVIGFIHPEDKEELFSQIRSFRQGHIASFKEYRIVLPCGKVKWLKSTIGEYIEGEGIYGTTQDITKSKLLELELENQAKELRLKNEDLQQFAYASSHDLQEPLRTITNFVKVLDKQLEGQLSTEQKMYMGIVINSTERMKNLILAILEYSRIGRNKALETFDCAEVIQNVMTDLSFSIQQAGAIVRVGPMPIITGYKTEFSTLMQNLIGNAIKFRRPHVAPIVIINSTSDEEHFEFSVQDNGIGMEKKHIDKIFHLFSRLHSKEDYEGTGIGLTHCKKIVELHGGKIWVDSVKNLGTTFYFSIAKNLKINIDEKEAELHFTGG